MKAPVYLIPFAHLDLFWAGNREECLSRGIEIIRSALRLLRKYPDYRFLIESANFLEFFCESSPDDAEELKKYAAEGRLEAVPMRSIMYTQLPSGETLIRNYLRGRQIVLDKLGVCGKIATLSDIPGVTPQLPQIAAKCGFSGLFLSHGTPPHTDCVEYAAPDGTTIATYAPIHYARTLHLFAEAADYDAMCAGESKVEEELGGVDYPQLCQFGTDLMVIRENVPENFHRWNKDGHRPFYFSTLTEFFASHFRPKGRISGEIPSLWPNVESSWPDLWPADREAESALSDAEYFQALTPRRFRKPEILRQAWDWLLDAMDHNQNGIGGDAADREKKDLKQAARMTAERLAKEGAVRIAASAGAPRAGAFPIVLFNRLSWSRRELVRARTCLYGETKMKMSGLRENNFRLIDPEGNEHPFRLVKHLQGSADSVEIEFTAEVPAFGTACYYLEKGETSVFPPSFEVDDPRLNERDGYAAPIRLKNAFWHLEIDRVTGELSLSGATERKYLDRAGIAGLEEKRGDYICCMDLTGRKFPAVIDTISPVRVSPVSAEIELTGTVYGIPFIQRIELAADSPKLRIENRIRWKSGNYVRLEQTFPLPGGEKTEIAYGVPFGLVRYPETIYKDGLHFDSIVTPERGNDPDDQIRKIRLASPFVSMNGLTIACDHRMWEFDDREIRSCMVRGIGWCSGAYEVLADGTRKSVRRPPDGEYVCRYVLTPGMDPKAGWEAAAPLYPAGVGISRPDAATFSQISLPDTGGTSVIGSSVKPSEDGEGIVVRLFESEGKSAVLTLPGSGWQEVDMLEGNPVPVSGPLPFRPFEIKTLFLALP